MYIVYISAHGIPGVLLSCTFAYICYSYISLAVITIVMGFNGAVVTGCLVNSADITPSYAGTVFSTIQLISNTAGILSPYVLAIFTNEINVRRKYVILCILRRIYRRVFTTLELKF